MSQDELKKAAAQRALDYLEEDGVIGVGTGSTVNFFIELLAQHKSKIETTVASSIATEKLLKQFHIPVTQLTAVNHVDVYIDGADEVNHFKQMIKGGGGALTREKIVAASAKKFVCMVDSSKYVEQLGRFPVAIEVIPMARSYVAREIVKLGGDPQYREGFITDNGNIILDVFNLQITKPEEMEMHINNIVGVVCNGIFARRFADVVLIAKPGAVDVLN